MSNELELRQWVDGWLAEHRAQLRDSQVKYHLATSQPGQLPKAKAVLRFEAPASHMQVDLWGSGEADVMEVRQGNITADHRSFEGRRSLVQFLDGCFRRLAAG
jgi:hypothetical protein